MLRVFAVSGLALAMSAACPAAAAISLSLFSSGYSAPVFATGLGNTLYVAEQGGRIVAVNRSTRAQSTFFTVPNIESGGEKGLLGLAFDPAYKSNGRFYVNVTSRVNGQLVSEIRRYTDPAIKAEASSVLLRVNQPYDNHNGGWLAFGPDKNLYIALGDGGSGNDPQNNAQNTASLLGKILRINVARDAFPADPNRNYTIPTTNPFRNEVYAYGLRNPFRSSFDKTTGDLWIGDVGQGRFEEVDRIAAGTSGQNFGWRPLEGTLPTPGVGDPIPPGTTPPVFGYDHSVGQSITGGYVYRGGRISELEGRYVFGDFVAGKLFSIALDGSNLTNFTGAATAFGGANWSSFAEDASRGLYVIDYGGRIFTLNGTRPVTSPQTELAASALSAVPENASWALLIAGFGLTGVAMRQRRRLPRRAV